MFSKYYVKPNKIKDRLIEVYWHFQRNDIVPLKNYGLVKRWIVSEILRFGECNNMCESWKGNVKLVAENKGIS